jgi:membrane protease YdiL (CAAX protease family)
VPDTPRRTAIHDEQPDEHATPPAPARVELEMHPPAADPGAAAALPTPWILTPRDRVPRWLAVLQVLLVCGIPTQFALVIPLLLIGIPLMDGPNLSLEMFATVSLLDTALIALLIRIFLTFSHERSEDVFVGPRPPRREIALGLLLIIPVTGLMIAIVQGLRAIAPWTHNVADSPFETYMRTPIEAAIFAVVVIIAGGVREELQRAFILHRFDQKLGGARLGLAIYTITFGVLHLTQGIDAAVAVGALGLVWGLLYIRRRSAIAPMVNHAGFDAAQVLLQVIAKATGM